MCSGDARTQKRKRRAERVGGLHLPPELFTGNKLTPRGDDGRSPASSRAGSSPGATSQRLSDSRNHSRSPSDSIACAPTACAPPPPQRTTSPADPQSAGQSRRSVRGRALRTSGTPLVKSVWDKNFVPPADDGGSPRVRGSRERLERTSRCETNALSSSCASASDRLLCAQRVPSGGSEDNDIAKLSGSGRVGLWSTPVTKPASQAGSTQGKAWRGCGVWGDVQLPEGGAADRLSASGRSLPGAVRDNSDFYAKEDGASTPLSALSALNGPSFGSRASSRGSPALRSRDNVDFYAVDVVSPTLSVTSGGRELASGALPSNEMCAAEGGSRWSDRESPQIMPIRGPRDNADFYAADYVITTPVSTHSTRDRAFQPRASGDTSTGGDGERQLAYRVPSPTPQTREKKDGSGCCVIS